MTDRQFQDAQAYDQLEALIRDGVEPSSVEDRDIAEMLEVVHMLESHPSERSVPHPEVFHRDVMQQVRGIRRRPWYMTGMAVAAAVLVVLFLPSAPPQNNQPTIMIEDEILDRAFAEQTRVDMLKYLKSTEHLLLAMRDFETSCRDDQTDLQPEKRIAKELLLKQKFLQASIDQPEFYQARQLFQQLEGILVDVNLLDNCTDPNDVEFINQHIERNRILGKLRLVAQEIQIS